MAATITTSNYSEYDSIAAPSVAPASKGRIYFDSTTNTFKVSVNQGSYNDIATTNQLTSYTTTTANFTQPAVNSNVQIAAGVTLWMIAGQILYIAGGGYYQVVSVDSGTLATIKNLGYTGNAAPSSTINSGAGVGPGGLQGVNGGINTTTGTYAARPAAGNNGNLYLPNNSAEIDRDNGATWDKWGPIYAMTRAPTSGNWTWINQGTGVVSDTGSGLWLTDATAHAGNSLRVLKRAIPTNKTVIAHCNFNGQCVGTPQAGVGWRQSSDGKLVVIGMMHSTTSCVSYSLKMTNPTTFSATYYQAFAYNQQFWVKLVDDGTNRLTYYSSDGQNWLLMHSVGRTDFLTADEVCIWCDASSGAVGLLVDSWYEN